MSTPELPFAAGRVALLDALRARGTAVVQAPPGTGKTTLAPQYVLEHVTGRVVVTQPRRVAARASAARIAELRGGVPGDEVGYTVRGDRAVSDDTRIEMVTPGVLLRRLLADPDLPGVGAVVLDEVHERHLESDLVFGMLAQLRELREDLCVVAMSATLDGARFARLLDTPSAPVVDVPSPVHPLDIRYAAASRSMTNRDRRSRTAVTDIVLDTVRRALDETTDGDVLVFVPTIRDTGSVADALASDGVTAAALHGRLSTAEQARIVSAHATGAHRRRVVVATDVAESSLTVPGVRVVVDSCLTRVARRDTTRDMSVLVTETASRASCIQRAGRAGREGPGTVYRCITDGEFAKSPEFAPPAVLTSDLTSALLDVACWGSPRGADLALPDPFPTAAADAAQHALQAIGALDGHGRATDEGRRLATVPTDPRLAHGGFEACRRVDVDTVARVLRVMDDAGTTDPVAAVRSARASDPVVRRYRRILSRAGHAPGPRLSGADAVGYTLACAFPGLVARRVGDSSRYLTVSGTGVVWHDPRAHSAEWIVVADLGRRPGGTESVVRSAVPLSADLAVEAASSRLTDTVTCTWTPGGATGSLRARRVRVLGAVELSVTPVSSREVSPEDRAAAVRAGLVEHGLDALEWTQNARDLRRRIHYLHLQGVPGYPDVGRGDDRFLDFVVPELAAGRRPDLAGLLRGLIPWDRPVDELAPETLELPTGRTVRIRYPETDTVADDGAPPVIATKLQDCFGLRSSPEIAGRRILFQLLSPARRPVAVTDDLAGFWHGSYAAVRAEMRGRYPKHSWPATP